MSTTTERIAVFDRTPPANIEAEQAVIGSMLLDNNTIPDVLELVAPTSFFRPDHATIVDAIADLYERSETVDALILYEELRRRRQLSETLTVVYIGEILDNTPTAANAAYYAKIVAEKAAAREVIRLAMELARNGFDGGAVAADLLAEAEQKVGDIMRGLPQQRKTITIRDACLKYVEALRLNRNRVFGSGISEVDYAIGGVGIGEMVVLGARPSHGKSAFALHWLHEASAAGIPCLMISEEMAAIELGKRSLLRFASVDQDLWDKDTADVLSRDVVRHYAQHAPIFIAEQCHTIAKAESAIRRYARDGVKIVAIDYLQLISGNGKQRNEQVGEVSRRLKIAAQKYEVAILALSQLNRGIEDRAVYSPKLRDVRESGQIEQDADCVLFLVWPWSAWNEETEAANGKSGNGKWSEPSKSEYRIIVGKNCRNRRTRTKRMVINFDSERMTFSSLPKDDGFTF